MAWSLLNFWQAQLIKRMGFVLGVHLGPVFDNIVYVGYWLIRLLLVLLLQCLPLALLALLLIKHGLKHLLR